MTTNVIIRAHCNDDTEVIVTIINGHEKEHVILKDGDEHELAIFDNRLLTVREAPNRL